MPENIKKRSASHIYYGISKATCDLVHISDVPSGLGCNCVCAVCQQPFVARKGKIRRPHFAHVSNYDCMEYPGEVAIYKAFAECLKSTSHMHVPSVVLDFPAWSKGELLKEPQEISIDEVSFSCGPLDYPPMLIATSHGSRLRIILEFGQYYETEDWNKLTQEAKQDGCSLLCYSMPKIDENQAFTMENIQAYLSSHERAKWIFSRLAENWRQKYYAASVTPPEHGMGYLCAISIGQYHGKYSARYIDCAHCHFNVATPPGCKCVAQAGIQCIDDFKRPFQERLKDIEQIRLKNEEDIRRREQRSNFRPKIVNYSSIRSAKPAEPVKAMEQAERDIEYARIRAEFNPESADPTIDRFGRRWLQCKVCKEIKQDWQMASYGGRDGMNLGVCSECSRKGLDPI